MNLKGNFWNNNFWNKTTTGSDVSVRGRHERQTHAERDTEGTDSDRNFPGLSPSLLSGRVCAGLSACLLSPLLSILLKIICLLIIT